MSRRKYRNIKAIKTELLYTHAQGKANREVEDLLGLKASKKLLHSYNREQESLPAGLPPKRKGGPPGK